MENKYGILTVNFYDLNPSLKAKKELLGYDEDDEVEDIDDEFEGMLNQYDVEEALSYYDIKVLKKKYINNVDEKYIIKGSEDDMNYLKDNYLFLEDKKNCSLKILEEKDIDNLIVNNL